MSESEASDQVITECDLPEAPEKVWASLVERKLLAKWLPEVLGCEVLAALPPRLLRYRWPAGAQDRDADGRELDSDVTFELSATPGGGTHLRVVHRVLAVAGLRTRAVATTHTPRGRSGHEPVALYYGLRRAA